MKNNRLPTENIDELSLLKSLSYFNVARFVLRMKCAVLILGEGTRSEDSA
jgi:hypothetical protein